MPGMPELRGVIIAPTVGGQQESDPVFQTNEIVREPSPTAPAADPRFVFAPAPAQSAVCGDSLQADPSFVGITDLWARASVLVSGIGAPYSSRESLTSVVPRDDPSLRDAVGDVCLHFYDPDGGRPWSTPARTVWSAPRREVTARHPHLDRARRRTRQDPVDPGRGEGRFTTLITDSPTAEALLADTESEQG